MALVAAPNALALLARTGPAAVDRFTAWWPPAGLDLLPVAVAGLVVLVTAFALATRGHRLRGARANGGRRFLPPLDLLLLQVGNVSFMAFALVLGVVTLGLLASGLRLLASHPGLLANDFAASVGVAAVATLSGLRSRSWRVSGGRWRQHAALLGLATGGLWLLIAMPGPSLPGLREAAGQLQPSALLSLYGLLWVLLGVSSMAAGFGWDGAGRADSTAPRRDPVAASLLAGVTYLAFLALYLSATLQTVRALLAAS